MMLMQCEFFNSPPKTTKVPKERRAHSPMLEMFIGLNEKDNKKYQGEGSAKDAKGKVGRGKKKNTLSFVCLFVVFFCFFFVFVLFCFFFFLINKILGFLPKIACFRF
uniref:Uncharacterized protein n=1 Tax=Opuntia streptacantha TaxID=393608 RepID=A0A7C8ZFL0_OPUST